MNENPHFKAALQHYRDLGIEPEFWRELQWYFGHAYVYAHPQFFAMWHSCWRKTPSVFETLADEPSDTWFIWNLFGSKKAFREFFIASLPEKEWAAFSRRKKGVLQPVRWYPMRRIFHFGALE